MTSKKGSNIGGMTALKIGSRVRCTDDGVEGRITWANGVSVKVRWDDGEQVTWRRDSLAERPIEILDPADEAEPDAVREAPTDEAQSVSTESPREELSRAILVPEEATTEPTQPHADSAASVTELTTPEPVPPAPEEAKGQTTPAIADAKAET